MFERRHIRFSATGAFRENVKKVLLGGTIVMAVRFGLKLLFPETVLLTYVRYVMVALTGGLIAPYLFVRTGISATLKA
jgi:hypothetical protein